MWTMWWWGSSFELRISSVSITKSAGNCDLVTFAEEIFNEKSFFCVVDQENVYTTSSLIHVDEVL